MQFELQFISEIATELGFTTFFRNPFQLEIELTSGIVFIFKNIETDNDNAFGFQGTPWHAHDKLVLAMGDDSFVEFIDIEIILSIKEGTILIYEQYNGGDLTDRWLIHKNDRYDNRYIEAGEENRIRCYPFHEIQRNQ